MTEAAHHGSDVAAVVATRGWLARLLLPPGVDASALPLLVGRALRGFCDGYIAVLLPAYLLGLGFAQLAVGLISSATLIGSALATILVGLFGNRFAQRSLLMLAAALMAVTGMGFAGLSALWPLLSVAFVGTLNPSSGDVSVFLPLEQARLAESAAPDARTALFARYSLIGACSAAIGALAAVLPSWLVAHLGLSFLAAMRVMFLFYALIGLVLWVLYARLPVHHPQAGGRATPLGPSRGIVIRLALLFSVDAFAGGLVVNALLSLWLMQRFGLSPGAAGQFFFWAGLLTTASQLVAVPLARKIGLLNTMVFTHIPSSLCLIAAALAPSLASTLTLLLMRSALSQMDVPTRTAYVMAVVTPPERTAAASLTSVPRSLAAAISPTLAGAMLAAGWIGAPLVACGILKIAYDLAILRGFRRIKPLN
ncbi:MFS transporter [Ralstonia pseudosolanacearum]|uniref:MFS transporter n=1 Tax=Ralstonia pseudosolanacearum TaxID=1310165 RepID=UPI0006767DBE|nr:MFS transporter [Ralstonia pseudosolanacearum]MDO3505784.1 MFS transporter [Ralstonia pseudosolanacearum]MDO3510983.1 MFS transporter [Ralstonia pseudosolanacearum]MDO3535477.1 MFS transporter [Ralstonia pseudosolanacearum]MDO3555219.1 MFS transporter [Ralstonia pseudosolanacearum]MDO3574781.1 MFS transporter [Ralstonia pseudosolanacearum]